MTPEEFQQIGEHVGQLWPLAALTGEQAKVWREKLATYSLDRVKSAISEAYARSTWREPSLGMVMDVLKELRKLDGPVFMPLMDEAKAQKIIDDDLARRRKHAKAMGATK